MSDDYFHNCHFCGELVRNGKDTNGNPHRLIDCRPDLVEHEPGNLCTWRGLTHKDGTPAHEPDCYAYQDHQNNAWTDQHVHFYPKDSLT